MSHVAKAGPDPSTVPVCHDVRLVRSVPSQRLSPPWALARFAEPGKGAQRHVPARHARRPACQACEETLARTVAAALMDVAQRAQPLRVSFPVPPPNRAASRQGGGVQTPCQGARARQRGRGAAVRRQPSMDGHATDGVRRGRGRQPTRAPDRRARGRQTRTSRAGAQASLSLSGSRPRTSLRPSEGGGGVAPPERRARPSAPLLPLPTRVDSGWGPRVAVLSLLLPGRRPADRGPTASAFRLPPLRPPSPECPVRLHVTSVFIVSAWPGRTGGSPRRSRELSERRLWPLPPAPPMALVNSPFDVARGWRIGPWEGEGVSPSHRTAIFVTYPYMAHHGGGA